MHLQEPLSEANITGDTTWEQARPLLELNPTFVMTWEFILSLSLLQELLSEANITGDTSWEQARPLLELNPTFAALPEAERRLAFDAAVAEKKRQVCGAMSSFHTSTVVEGLQTSCRQSDAAAAAARNTIHGMAATFQRCLKSVCFAINCTHCLCRRAP